MMNVATELLPPDLPITRIRVAECRIPLPREIKLSATRITTRDYTCLRIETADGTAGEAIGYTRGTPLAAMLETYGRRLLGGDAVMRNALVARLVQTNQPGRANLSRALSLVDIALWDLGAKQARLPLYRLLGGLRRAVPATAVGGYYLDALGRDAIVRDAAALRDAGYQRIKLMLLGDDAAFDRDLVAAMTEGAPGRLAADAHWSWRGVTEAARACRMLDDFGLEFIEDPFSAVDAGLMAELGRRIRTPLAAGEDIYGTRILSALASVVDVLRVDATAGGGISGALSAIAHAEGFGKIVFPHVFLPLHVQLAAAFEAIEGVEMIAVSTGADPLEKILRIAPRVVDGMAMVGEEPGVGLTIDWETVERTAVRAITMEPES